MAARRLPSWWGAAPPGPRLRSNTLRQSSLNTTGGIGLLGTAPSQEVMEDCEALLMIGTSFPYIEFLPKPKGVRGIQIELNPKKVGLRFPVEVGLVGDSRRVLRELLPRG